MPCREDLQEAAAQIKYGKLSMHKTLGAVYICVLLMGKLSP